VHNGCLILGQTPTKDKMERDKYLGFFLMVSPDLGFTTPSSLVMRPDTLLEKQ
jgi:hypothetical protein